MLSLLTAAGVEGMTLLDFARLRDKGAGVVGGVGAATVGLRQKGHDVRSTFEVRGSSVCYHLH